MEGTSKAGKMATLARLGVDSSKRYMHVHGVDEQGRVVVAKSLRREEFLVWAANLAKCLIGLEACSASHYWARELRQLGHAVRIMAAEHVSPYRKSRKGKNDANDAEAICEAVGRPNMRFVTVKSEEQQALLILHRVREGWVHERTGLICRIRGLLAEFGIWIGQSPERLSAWFKRSPQEREGLPLLARAGLDQARAHWQALDERIAELDQRIAEATKVSEAAMRLQKMTGVGLITASAVVASVVDGKQYKNGREMSAALGLVPSQHSTGGKTVLGRITKRGDAYLRHLLVQGARSAISAAQRKKPEKLTRLERWMLELNARVGYYKALVAIANKHARIIWAVLAKGEAYDPKYGQALN
jgi:transposase